jgi:hypothetical protein
MLNGKAKRILLLKGHVRKYAHIFVENFVKFDVKIETPMYFFSTEHTAYLPS